jgi:AbrB family looped-hinge helix DNA binding protein
MKPMANEISYLTVDRKGRATLPEEVRASLAVKAGDLVLLERTERGTYELVPAALVPRDQLWFHHPAMQRRIRKAEADLAEGRAKATHSPEEAQALLDSFKAKRRRRHG